MANDASSSRLHNRLIQQRIELLEAEIERQKELGQDTRRYTDDVRSLRTTQESLNRHIQAAERFVSRYAASMTAAALATKAYNVATSSAQKQTEHFIHTAQGLDAVSTSYDTIGKRAKAYQEIVKDDIRLAHRYGMAVKDVQRVSDAWIQQMRFVGEYTRDNQKQIVDLTDATLKYSKVMGIDGVELSKKAAHRMFQYGESAETALDKLVTMHMAARAVNEEVAKLTGSPASTLWADDFAKLVEEAAGKTRNFTQDLDMLTAAMAYSVQEAAKAGQAYNATLEAGKAMGQFIQGGGENATNVTLGLRMLDRLKDAMGPDGKLSEEFLKDFTETQQADMQRIADSVGIVNSRDLALYLQDSMATSKVGIEELLSLTKQLGAETGDIVPILMQQRQMTRGQAIEMARQLREAESMESVAEGIFKQLEAQNGQTKEMKDNVEGMTALLRASGGKVTGVEAIDNILLRVDNTIGDVVAHFSDAETLAKAAIVALVVGGAQFMRAMGGVRATFATILNMSRGIAVNMGAAARGVAAAGATGKAGAGLGGMATAGITRGMTAALAPYSAGRALRVVGMGGAGGGKGGTAVVGAGGGDGKGGKGGGGKGGGGGKPAKGGRMRGGGGRFGALAMLGAYLGADYLLSSSPDADPNSFGEQAKGWGMTGLNAAMIWSMLGAPGKGALMSGGSSLLGMLGIGGGGATTVSAGTGTAAASGAYAAGAGGGGSSLASILGGGALATAGGLAATAGIVAGAFLALPALAGYAGMPENKLRQLARSVKQPMSKKWLGTSYFEYVEYLAKNPSTAEKLYKEGVISEDMYSHTVLLAEASRQTGKDVTSGDAWQSMWNLEEQGVTYADVGGGTATRAAQQQSTAGSLTGGSMRIVGAGGQGQITEVTSGGRARMIVPMEIEVENALAIPAQYDRLKTDFGG